MDWLIDAYRHRDSIVLWTKRDGRNVRVSVPWTAKIYLLRDATGEAFIQTHHLAHRLVRRKNHMSETV
ncbi:MAG: hypothetical protein ABIH41_06930, partial [Nanoarchaeota archaeon]